MNVTKSRLARVVIISTLSINSAMALPIDWSGVFGVDTHLLSNICRTKDNVPTKNASSKTGTEGLPGDCGANFQTYVFKLNPQIIVNDGVTLKGELSSGYIRGGFAGDNSANNQDGTGNNSYYFTTPAQRSGLNVNQMYMEVYADTALIKLGRMSKHYGLGAIWDNGNDPWDRFFTMYDGAEAEMKIGNFSLIPSWAKISSYNDANSRAQPNGSWDVRETGVVAKYDNKNTDLVASILYAKRFSERKNSLYNTTTTSGDQDRGKTQVTIIDPYVSKKWNKFKVAFEAPMMSGTYGDVYGNGDKSKIAAKSYILEAKYDLNPKWDMGLNAGQISGDKGSTSKFEATYLHPNYQIADLMFRYHYPSFNEGTKSIFDSSITNTRYYKIFAHYKADKWTWRGAFVMANAMETAKAGSRAYHHEENYAFNSNYKQKNNMGWEVDFGFDYRWNPNMTVGGYYGYWKVGDYYGYTNTATSLTMSSVHGGGLRATLEF
ncbi:MAG: hypothetical protein AB7I27_04410 [Bacteriovoracaceae bacterium]